MNTILMLPIMPTTGVWAREFLLMGSPLKLDLGVPITAPDDADGGTQFNFSFGTRF